MFDAAAMTTPGPAACAVLDVVDPGSLGDGGLIAFAQAAERQVAHANAILLDTVRVLADRAEARVTEEADIERHPLDHIGLPERVALVEVAQALRISRDAAGNRVSLGRALAGSLAPAAAMLRAGQLSMGHVYALDRFATTLTQDAAGDALLAAVLERCLPRAGRQTPSALTRSLAVAAIRIDPAGRARVVRDAVAERTGLEHRDLDDGLGQLVFTGAAPLTRWAFDVLNVMARDARRRCAGTDPSGDAHTGDAQTRDAETAHEVTPSLPWLRAEALLEVLRRATADPTFPTTHGDVGVDIQVVIDLATLMGLRDDPTTINGIPVPAPIAHEFVTPGSTLQRLITDPVTGHLLDAGRRRRSPAALTSFTMRRDRVCRVPGCSMPARVCDLDHAIPHERAGPTNTANMGVLCRGHHTLKTAGFLDLVDSRADGSATLITALGQRYPIAPRSQLPG